MTNYRRAHTPGATWFFTVNIARRDTTVLADHIALLRQALQYVQRRHPFTIDAMGVLPDHLHAVWTLPLAAARIAMHWRQLKGSFSSHVRAGEHAIASRLATSARGTGHRSNWGHLRHDTEDPNIG